MDNKTRQYTGSLEYRILKLEHMWDNLIEALTNISYRAQDFQAYCSKCNLINPTICNNEDCVQGLNPKDDEV